MRGLRVMRGFCVRCAHVLLYALTLIVTRARHACAAHHGCCLRVLGACVVYCVRVSCMLRKLRRMPTAARAAWACCTCCAHHAQAALFVHVRRLLQRARFACSVCATYTVAAQHTAIRARTAQTGHARRPRTQRTHTHNTRVPWAMALTYTYLLNLCVLHTDTNRTASQSELCSVR